MWYDTIAVWDTLGWENGPYPGGLPFYVEDVAGINQLGDLTIEPGVVILEDSNGTFVASAGGALSASGTANDPVVFDVNDSIQGSWGGIDIVGTSSCALYECTIRNAGYGRTEVVFLDYLTYWFNIDHCRFENNNAADYVIVAQELYGGQIINNTFEYNSSGIIRMSALTAGILDIYGNSATGNLVNGISVDCTDPLISYVSWEADLPYVL